MSFLVLPWVKIPHLASRVLAANMKVLHRDWQAFSTPRCGWPRPLWTSPGSKAPVTRPRTGSTWERQPAAPSGEPAIIIMASPRQSLSILWINNSGRDCMGEANSQACQIQWLCMLIVALLQRIYELETPGWGKTHRSQASLLHPILLLMEMIRIPPRTSKDHPEASRRSAGHKGHKQELLEPTKTEHVFPATHYRPGIKSHFASLPGYSRQGPSISGEQCRRDALVSSSGLGPKKNYSFWSVWPMPRRPKFTP